MFKGLLKAKLEQHVNGKVMVMFFDDDMVVQICSPYSIIFKTAFYNFTSEIVKGIDVNLVYRKVVQDYSKHIQSHFFK